MRRPIDTLNCCMRHQRLTQIVDHALWSVDPAMIGANVERTAKRHGDRDPRRRYTRRRNQEAASLRTGAVSECIKVCSEDVECRRSAGLNDDGTERSRDGLSLDDADRRRDLRLPGSVDETKRRPSRQLARALTGVREGECLHELTTGFPMKVGRRRSCAALQVGAGVAA